MADDQGSIASNAEVRARWRIAPEVDPQTLLETESSNGDWFEQNKALDLFALPQGPGTFHPRSQFGPYWSLTNFADVKFVDAIKLFSSDIMNGGIRLGANRHRTATGLIPFADVHYADQPVR